ncbi:MAG: 3-deoxy-7-phosphoheptulonate synthase [Christensenellales bacterium]|jgi:3-deoxy-7-phosphoheptulonate synthase
MIIIMRPDASECEVQNIEHELENDGLQVQKNLGTHCVVLGVIGDTTIVDKEKYNLRSGVDRILKVQEPFKKANRKFHPEPSVIEVGGIKIGGGRLCVAAGPCSVESEEQIESIAQSVKQSGAQFLRGGAYKPRSSPYSFQGLKDDGLRLLHEARKETGLPIISELLALEHMDAFFRYDVDVIQIGARNMQNFELLKHVGEIDKPVMLKRGLSCTIEEWLMSAEYIMSKGNEKVILCERGIRTFETYTRNTLDVSAIPAVKRLSHLPIMVDPSHAAGLWWMVEPLSLAAVAAGADGLLVEVHNDPEHALSDGAQSITPKRFAGLMNKIRVISSVTGHDLQEDRYANHN